MDPSFVDHVLSDNDQIEVGATVIIFESKD